MTNKQVFEEGQIIEHYPMDINPFTGEMKSNGGIEYLIQIDNTVYSIQTDWDNNITDPNGTPMVISVDAAKFIKDVYGNESSHPNDIAEAEEQLKRDDDELNMQYYWDESQFDARAWMRDDDW